MFLCHNYKYTLRTICLCYSEQSHQCALIFEDLCLLLKQTQTSRTPQYPRQTSELKECESTKYLHGWSSSHAGIFDQKLCWWRIRRRFKMQIVFLFTWSCCIAVGMPRNKRGGKKSWLHIWNHITCSKPDCLNQLAAVYISLFSNQHLAISKIGKTKKQNCFNLKLQLFRLYFRLSEARSLFD